MPGLDYTNTFRGSTVLITGGAGFIGSHLAARLLELGATVRVVDDLSSGHAANVPAGASLVRASILDEPAVRSAATGCDFVFHQAAMVSVPQSVEQPARCMDVNVTGTELVLRAARDAKAKRVLLAASAAAYGGNPNLPSRDTDAPDCWSPYAARKVAGQLPNETVGVVEV